MAVEMKKKLCGICHNIFYGKEGELLCYLCKMIIKLFKAFDSSLSEGDKGVAINRLWAWIQKPDWDDASKCHDWKNYIPQQLKDDWHKYTDETRAVAIMFAQHQADAEEWD